MAIRERECTSCLLIQPLGNFCKHKDRPLGHTFTCKSCKNEQRRTSYSGKSEEWKDSRQKQRSLVDKDPKHVKRRNEYATNVSRYTKYGITKEIFDEMLEKQGGVCAICKRSNPVKRAFAIDHNHATGKFRGVLCHYCNTSLGGFQDSEEVLKEAINYLKERGSYAE